jgi:hypothetical protein
MADHDDFIIQLFDSGNPIDDATRQRLGALQYLYGEWESLSGSGTGWNVIAVPVVDAANPRQGFVLEVIPYYEKLSFKPALVAQNRGPAFIGARNEYNAALVYEQSIFSDCPGDPASVCAQRGFPKDSLIHRETGMLMNMTGAQVGSLPIVRMGQIPHGNSILCLGNANSTKGQAPHIPMSSIAPFSATTQPLPLGYGEILYNEQQFPTFDQSNPNAQLVAANAKIDEFKSVTHIALSSMTHEGGGVLNIPFLRDHVSTQQVSVDYWLSIYHDPVLKSDYFQLQYSQTIILNFPDSSGQLVSWPHVTVNTLVKVS